MPKEFTLGFESNICGGGQRGLHDLRNQSLNVGPIFESKARSIKGCFGASKFLGHKILM